MAIQAKYLNWNSIQNLSLKSKEEKMKNNLENIIDHLSDEDLEEVLDNIVFQLRSILEQAGVGHVMDNQLTSLLASENDTIH